MRTTKKRRMLGHDRPLWEQILRPILVLVIIAGVWLLFNLSRFFPV